LSPRLRQILEQSPATDVADVLGRMRAVVDALPQSDGVRAFTALYLAVTEAVEEDLQHAEFEDDAFVRSLDVVFANLYFESLRNAILAAGPVPKAWAPLIGARRKRNVLALQFALAGMNAHINRDLPIAIVATCELRAVALRDGSPQQRDFRRINPLLARVEDRVKADLVTDGIRQFDLALGDLDDLIAMWKVERAREAAWTNAEALWAIRRLPNLRGEFLKTLDGLVALAGRGLLRPLLLRSARGSGIEH
jgi:hypothetical protein